jgi:hypothetical protein
LLERGILAEIVKDRIIKNGMRFVIRTRHPPYTSKRPWSIPISISGWAALPWTRLETCLWGSALRAAASFRAYTLRDVLRAIPLVQCQARSCCSMEAARSSIRSNAGETTAACRLIRWMIVRSGTPTSTTPRLAASTGAHELELLSSTPAMLTESEHKDQVQRASAEVIDFSGGRQQVSTNSFLKRITGITTAFQI